MPETVICACGLAMRESPIAEIDRERVLKLAAAADSEKAFECPACRVRVVVAYTMPGWDRD